MRKKLLILDIDETLLHSDILEPDNGPDFILVDKYFSVKRPYVNKFLEYAFLNFEVGVFTTATNKYASEALTNLGVDLSKLKFLWTREECTHKYDINKHEFFYLKKLDKVKNIFKIDLSSVLIVDDNESTSKDNYDNLIKIDPFYYNNDDKELLKLISYLEKIKNEIDVRTIEKIGWSKN